MVSRNPSPLGSRTLTGDTLVEILRQRFRLGRRRIIAAVLDLTEDQLRWKPAPFKVMFTPFPAIAWPNASPASTPATEGGRFARDLLAGWDGYLHASSAAAAVYEVLRSVLLDATLGRIRESLPGPKPTEIQMIRSLLGPLMHAIVNDEPLFLDRLSYESWDEPLAAAFDATAAYLDKQLGRDEWAWGKLHFIEFRHDLSRMEGGAALFNVGPFPVGGDTSTVCMAALSGKFDFRTGDNPTYRQIVDLDDVRRSVFIVAPGQSGHIASPHYADLVHDRLNLRYRPLLWDAADIEANAEGRLILTP